MKRILFVAEDLFPLGPSQSLIRRIHDLAAEGIDVHVGLLHPLAADVSTSAPVTVHRLSDATARTKADDSGLESRLFSLLLNRRSLSAIFRIRKLVKNLQPDRVHAWCTPAAMLSSAAVLGLSGSNMPELVCSEYFLRQPKGVGQGAHFFRRESFRTFVPDERIGREMMSLGLAGELIVIPNRVQCGTAMLPRVDRKDAAAMLRSELRLPQDSKIAVAVAPLIAQARIKDLIWATDLLAVIRNDFHLAVFGCGVRYSDLRRFSDLTEAGQRVHFLGRPANAWPLFQGGDVYWHSHLLEPLPVNMLNAMSFGIPVVSVLGDGTSSVVKHQSTGFATNFGARDEFARWTKYLLELPEKAELLAGQAKLFAESEFGNGIDFCIQKGSSP